VSAAARIADELARCQIKLVASLPDNWIAEVIETLDGDERFVHVRVNREESAIGLCSGAFFGGQGALALMGASGLMTCVYAITKINYTYEVPILIFTTLRGALGDPAHHHLSNGLYLTRVLDAISLPYTIVEREDQIPLIAQAYRQARTMNRPYVVAFTRQVLRGGS
jgi:sulfopyruvate decarboxylase TPP-binding subunit